MIHHLELWVNEPITDIPEWDWLLLTLGWTPLDPWSGGKGWQSGPTYIVLTGAPALDEGTLNRRHAGMNHVALTVVSEKLLHQTLDECGTHGWMPLYGDRYPARGTHGALVAYLESTSGWKVELVGPSANN